MKACRRRRENKRRRKKEDEKERKNLCFFSLCFLHTSSALKVCAVKVSVMWKLQGDELEVFQRGGNSQELVLCCSTIDGEGPAVTSEIEVASAVVTGSKLELMQGTPTTRDIQKTPQNVQL